MPTQLSPRGFTPYYARHYRHFAVYTYAERRRYASLQADTREQQLPLLIIAAILRRHALYFATYFALRHALITAFIFALSRRSTRLPIHAVYFAML